MFSFIDKNTKQVLTLGEMDKIVCNFWGVEIHSKYYAQPKTKGPNWFDVLGKAIEDCQYFKHKAFKVNDYEDKCFDMDTISSMVLFQLSQYEESADSKMEQVALLRPYVELCYYLKSLNIVGSGHGW